MDAATLQALQARTTLLPGGRDRQERPVIIVPVPATTQEQQHQQPIKDDLNISLKYLLSIFSERTKSAGLTVIVDAQRGSWRIARLCIRQVTDTFSSGELALLIVLRPDAFWDKQRVENCTKTHKDGQAIYIPRSRLNKYVDISQLPEELGGRYIYNHNKWIENRLKVEEFVRDANEALTDLEQLRQHLLDNRSVRVRAFEIERALNTSADMNESTRMLVHSVTETGKELLQNIEYENRNRKFDSEYEAMSTSQDTLDTIEAMEGLLSDIQKKKLTIDDAWIKMEKSFIDAKDLSVLEDGVARVTNWILGPAEMLLNSQKRVGFDVISAEELRREHESLELQCWNTYGHYAELLHKIDSFPLSDLSVQQKDLLSQRDFMDFVCRSFATRLERRRNILITSLRFFRLVSEYFDKTSEVFESLVMGNKVEDFSLAAKKLHELQGNQVTLDAVERELVKEGEKLSDMLSMPVKDALGRDVAINYEEDIINIRDILDATSSRKNIFSDSVELQKLTLDQVTHINCYEKDVEQAVEWIDELFNVMISEHGFVGCNVNEIQMQKDDHQAFQETAKGTYNYGCQLLNASLALRQSCKLPVNDHSALTQTLKQSWQRLLTVSQEQMTRLRVSAVFHRSVDEHCIQLHNLREAVESMPQEDVPRKRVRVRKFMASREKLLVEVGRMMRLGRLLRTRLREPLYVCDRMSASDGDDDVTRPIITWADSDQDAINEGNATAVESISERLAEVTGLAEQLDMALRGAQEDCAIGTSSNATVSPTIKKILDGTSAAGDIEWNPASKKNGDDDADEEFVTASECTYPQSRSSSFNTTSEPGHFSPWWEFDQKGDINEDISKEKMVLAVGCPDLPAAKSVLKPSPEAPPGKIVHEVTETTHIKVQHCHTLGVSSFVLTSETVRDGKGETSAKKQDVKELLAVQEGREIMVPVTVEKDVDEDEFMRRMKESGDWIQLKILEVEPELTKLGNTLQEALDLQKAHDDVLLQLQNKQSPVEELLRQADQLISTQRPRAEVYAAMAESLGRAWKDVNATLELRKQILDLNVLYHRRAQEFHQKVDALEASCKDTMIPIEIEAVKTFLTTIHELRRNILEALMGALQAGNQLLAKLKELGIEGTLDSRPDRIRASVNRAISQVEKWLDELHLKRQIIELSWQTRKTQLEQCLALALLARDLRELEDAVSESRELLSNSDHLGDSSSSAELLLHEHKKLIPEARQLQERALKITKATEQLVSSGCFAGEQATHQAYSVLSATSDYLSDLEQRENLLQRAINFFRNAQTALTKLDQLEVQLKTSELPSTSPQLAQLHGQCAQAIEEITSAPLLEGHQLLNDAGRGQTGTEGVKRMVEELENRKIFLDGLCTAHREENLRISQALTIFLEKQNELYSWLISIAEAFLQGHQDMGSDSPMAKNFLNLHNQLLNDLQTKGNEINSLLLTLPPILEYLDDAQRHDVDVKVESLHEHWLKLKNILEIRLDLAAVYVRFHTEADTVSKAMDELEDSLKNSPPDVRDNIIEQLEEKWSSLVPLYQHAKNTGLNFITQSTKVQEPYLDTKRACLCVESVLERLAGRQLTVTRNWQSFQTDIVERRELTIQWERTMTESSQTLDWVSKLGFQLYPVITSLSSNPKDISADLERKLTNNLGELRRAQNEVDSRIKTIDSLSQKSQNLDEGAIVIRSKLNDLSQTLIQIITDYQVLLEMLINYFNSLASIDHTINVSENTYSFSNLPNDIYELEDIMRRHEASEQVVLDVVRQNQEECEKLISRIRKQEPPTAAEQDIEKLLYSLEMRKKTRESKWKEQKEILDQHRQLCQFNTDLHQINETLDDLGRQLSGVKGQYGESLASAKATSVAFVYFEKTIELLQQRIQTFVNTGEQLLAEQHWQSPHIEREIKRLKDRWNEFQNQVKETRRLIDLSIQYFQLVEEADEWFREGSKLLVTIARKSTSVKQPEEATELLNEVAMFLKPGEERQNERIKKISSLAVELYGIESSKQVTQVIVENREMLDSFTTISNELNTLARNLRAAEEQREKLRREKEQADANLAALKAEAAAAEAAAAAAEEARRAAEAAAKAFQESVHIERIEKVEFVKTEAQPIPEPPKVIEVEELPQPKAPEFIVPLTDAVIQEGSRFTFECQVIGYPLPVVTWHKDGISIQNNPDYQTTFDQGLCTLTIEETFAEDSARYTCKGINAAGTAETAATLSVKETEPEEQLMPPVFSRLLSPATAKEGSTFKFECKVEGNPLPTVQWYKNFECIDNSPDFVITYNNGDAVLKFEEVFLEDKAEYTCKATNEMGVAQSTASLSVEPLEPTAAPEFTVPLSNIMARAGQKIKLECEVTGLPQPQLLWTHNGRPLKEGRDVKLQYDNKKATVVISEAFPKDAGTYIVTATNLAGEAASACNVSVKGRLPTETSDSELASDMEPIKPSIQMPLKDLSIFEGKRVRLDCIIVGQPEPEVIWYKDGKPVKESTDFQLLFQGDRCSLIIQEAFSEDAGSYKVIALNSAGEASSQCKLTVTPVGDAEKTTKPIEEKPAVVGNPPKFTKLLSDVLVSEGDRVILECLVSGEPTPEIKWLLNNQEIHTNEHYKFTQDADGTVKLEIEHVVPDDKGVYTVKASNALGDAKCFSQLIVKSLRSPPEVTRIVHEEPKIPPVFKELFADRSCFEEQSTKFECIVTGKPTPKIRWLFNGEAVSGKDFLISTSGERQVLAIPKISLQNQGKVTCVAENEAGKATCEAVLRVQPIALVTLPEMPKPLSSEQHSEYSMKREVFVQSSSSSKIISSSSGVSEPQVQVHSVASQDHQSFKQINQDAPEIKQSHKLEEFHQINKEPPVINEKSYSSFTSGHETKVQSIVERPIIQKPVRKAQPPRFITPVVGKIVDQGVDVTLEGIVDGYPAPDVTWSKNGITLESNENMKITFELSHAKIVLKNVSVKDAGKYTCTAVNEAGSAVSTTDLVVKKSIFPPVFGRRLQAQVVKKGDRLIMEVEITGTPEPTVTWHKDDMPLETKLTDGYRMKTQGNCHTLIIEKAGMNHTGKYMVRAVNSGGEAQSIADIAVFEPTPETMVEMVKTVVFEDVQKQEIMSTADQIKTTTPTPVSKPVTIEKSLPIAIIPERKIEPIISHTSHITESFESASQMSTVTENRVSQSVTKVTLGHTTPTLPAMKPYEPKPKETTIPITVDKDFPKKEEKTTFIEVKTEPQPDQSIIETSSISKQSSLDFFVTKMKEADKPVEPKLVETQKISPDIYTKFEEISTVKTPEPIITHDVKREVQTTFDKDFKSFSSSTTQQYTSSQAQLFEEFHLTPEPPAEIIYMPKTETTQKREDVTDKIKKLEDSQRDLSPMEVPTGAVKIFPTVPPKPKPAPVIEEPKKEVVHKISVQQVEDRKEKVEIIQPPVPAADSKHWAPVRFTPEPPKQVEVPVYSPQPPMETKPYSPVSFSPRPFSPRPVSPRPSAEAVQMERLWAPTVPLGPELPIPEPVRAPSPKPSSQGLAMEKLWTQKSESSFSSFTKPPAPVAAPVEPSVQGKTMEKMWAHKHSESNLKTVWPPVQPEEPVPVQKPIHVIVERQKPFVESKSESIVKESSSFSKTHHEFRSVQPPQPIVPPPVLIPVTPVTQPVTHYIATVSNVANFATQQVSTASSYSHTSESTEVFRSHNENVIEEHQTKASDIIRAWPPVPLPHEEPPLKAPQMVKETFPKIDSLPIRPVSVQDITDEVYLEPGPPPEIGFAQAPRERRQSYVETIEQDLEKNLDKEPSRVLPGSVRTIPPPREKSLPPPLPPKKEQFPQGPPLPAKTIKIEPVKKPVELESKPFERFPDLEPFPFKPQQEKPKSPKPPPPPTPSKFIKGKFCDSDYESDFELVRIPAKWKPCVSDTEEPSYKKVKPPKLTQTTRSRSTEPEPIPPSKFDQPPHFQGPPRPTLDLETTKRELKKEFTVTKISKQQQQQQQQIRREVRVPVVQPKVLPVVQPKVQPKIPSPPELKPGSPPIYIQAEPIKKPGSPKQKPESPKSKQKFHKESGYMADTDEPFTLTRKSAKVEHHRTEETSKTEVRQFTQSFESSSQSSQKVMVETRSSTVPQVPPRVTHKYEHKKHVSSSTASKKELVAPVVSVTNQRVIHKEERDSSLEAFPYKPDPPRPKRAKIPPPPSPSKFVKGEFKESDYESDYDRRIPPVWKKEDLSYKPVHPVLTPTGHQSRSTTARTPTPPTEFDHPPQIEYPPRPKFEPIEKHKQTVKLDEILKTTSKQQVVVKPKAVAAKPAPMMELIIATPAVPEPTLKPGSPPEMAYAPTAKKTQYYRSVTGMPYHNATQTETSNIMHFNESTEKSHRVVSVQQTTRVIKFGDSQQQRQEQQTHLEPFPYKPEPEKPRKIKAPPPPKPKKFVPGEFRESDYESEVESAKIKARWTPGYSDSDEPHFRKVKAPPPGRSSSVPIPQHRVQTPMEFDTQPPVIPTFTSLIRKEVVDGDSSVKRVTKRFGETKSSQSVKQVKSYKSNDVELHPGTPPEYAYSPVTIPVKKATEIASLHMEDMTHTFKSKAQKFVNDIMTDVKTPQKPILKATSEGDSDAQAYREESRVAQYGTKHVDPDTGLIYFKYDFGYEFGVILPGQSKNGEIPQPKKTVIQPPKRSSDIELPVYHETTKPTPNSSNATPTPTNKNTQFRPKKFTPQSKNVKWEPTSESEMSEIEGDSSYKKRYSFPQPNQMSKISVPSNAQWERASTSPVSLSPSLPSMSPAFNTTIAGSQGGSSWTSPGKARRGADTPPSTPSTPGSTLVGQNNLSQPKKAPMFITPLRDIAVVSGQTARFECIVQSEPAPSIMWSKNGRIIQNSQDYQLLYRNGVCRLTIPQAYPEDAGTYTCTATNVVGAVNTTANLQVPGERRSSYIK